MTPVDVQMLIFKTPALNPATLSQKTAGNEVSKLNTSVNQPSMIANQSLSKDPSSAQLLTQVPPPANNLKPTEDTLA